MTNLRINPLPLPVFEGDVEYFVGAARILACNPGEYLIVVYGTPASQGSKVYGISKAGKAYGREVTSKTLKPWRTDVRDAAREQIGPIKLDGDLVVSMTFTLKKPSNAPKRKTSRPNKQPDISKLARGVEDSLTEAGVWTDDARVVGYDRLWKVYPNEGVDALDVPGVVIRIRELQ